MKKMKKMVAGILTAAMLTAALSGCSGSGNNRETPAPGAGDASPAATATASKERVNIEFWHCMSSSNGELIQAMVDDYNTSQDKVYVEAIYQGSYYDAGTKLQAAVSAGEAPAIAQMEIGRIGLYADADQLVDLFPYFERDGEDLSDFQEGLMNYSYYNDKLISLPNGRSLPVLYYNKDLFAAAGLDPEKGPATWDELVEFSALLTTDDVYGYSCPIDSWYYLALVMSAGSPLFNEAGDNIAFNNEAGTKPLELWLSMIEDGTMYVPAGQEYNSSEACRSAFMSGTAGMIMQSSAQLRGLETNCEFEVGVAFMPKDVQYAVPPGGANLMMCVGQTAEEEDAAWDFMKYMCSTESAVRWAVGTGYLPTRYSCEDNPEFKEALAANNNLQITVDQVQYGNHPSPFSVAYEEVKDTVINNEIQKCILDESYTPEMAVQAIYDSAAKIFN